jgi:hypothetical protein
MSPAGCAIAISDTLKTLLDQIFYSRFDLSAQGIKLAERDRLRTQRLVVISEHDPTVAQLARAHTA